MQFFIPQAKKAEYEVQYQAIIDALKDQFRWTINDRKIFSLSYLHDKKDYTVEVGRLEPLENRYETVAILESSTYLVFTRTKSGAPGVTILVNKDEAQSVVDFD